jgi:hypothetical protein
MLAWQSVDLSSYYHPEQLLVNIALVFMISFCRTGPAAYWRMPFTVLLARMCCTHLTIAL